MVVTFGGSPGMCGEAAEQSLERLPCQVTQAQPWPLDQYEVWFLSEPLNSCSFMVGLQERHQQARSGGKEGLLEDVGRLLSVGSAYATDCGRLREAWRDCTVGHRARLRQTVLRAG